MSHEMIVKAESITKPMPINKIFPDEEFAKVVRDGLGKAAVTDVVSQTELNTMSEINIVAVESIEGIQYLNNLNTIEAYLCPISDLNKLTNLSNLKYLALQSCDLSDLSFVSDLVNLEELSVQENKICDISPLSSLLNLTSVSLYGQEITSIPVFYQENLVIPNTVKNGDATLIPPSEISNSGTYLSPNITWDLPAFIDSVDYSFDQKVTFGNIRATFSGTVEQPLKLGYKAIFDVDGTQTNELVEENDVIPEPADPIKEGHTFIGWYDAETGGTKWDFSTGKMPPNDKILYAQFNINSYTATLDVDGTTTSQTIVYQENLTEPIAPTKEEHTFLGWYDAKTDGAKWEFNTDRMPAKDMTLYAQFNVNKYLVTLDIDGETTNQLIGYQTLLPEPTAPTKEGYTFTGWYDAQIDGIKWDFSTETMPANDVTLYAQFSINNYAVTFDVDGKTTNQSIVYQGYMAQPVDPSKEGYTFTGWYNAKKGGTKWDFSTGTMPPKDMVLYAQFSENKNTAGGNKTPGQVTNPNNKPNNKPNYNKPILVQGQGDASAKILPKTGDKATVPLMFIGILCIGFSIHAFRQTYNGSSPE
ncbi:InlB B-repeat-containing protein [Listeria seeligeri]|uniref:InlB B-repeat-containing protein n=3 Tax=Listeria seeligeri TaxID=1640 RepID=UPI0035DF03AA